MLRAVLHGIVRILFRVISRLDVTGQENLPVYGAAILASNHIHLLDAPLIFAAVERKDLIALVGHTHRKTWWLRGLVEATNGIWINRDTADLHALRAAREHLEGGGLLGIAPEGTRSRTGALIHAKTGVAYLADKANVPIIPVAIWGTETIVAHLRRLRRAHVSIHFGEAFLLPPLGHGDRSEALQNNTDELMAHIAAMLPENYRGVYKDCLELKRVGKTS
jgi:1-acyl-sn-glycerol-3-phosphate acyltransferase